MALPAKVSVAASGRQGRNIPTGGMGLSWDMGVSRNFYLLKLRTGTTFLNSTDSERSRFNNY